MPRPLKREKLANKWWGLDWKQAKEWSLTIILHHIEKSTQDGIKPKYKIANRKKNVHKIHNIEFDNDFLDRTPKVQTQNQK